jgi:hypothetical protein
MQPYRLFSISPIMSITGLHIVCVYTIHCISYKDCYKWSLDLDFPFAEITITGSIKTRPKNAFIHRFGTSPCLHCHYSLFSSIGHSFYPRNIQPIHTDHVWRASTYICGWIRKCQIVMIPPKLQRNYP